MALLTSAAMAAPSLPELLSSNRAPTDDERRSTLALIQDWRAEEAALEAEVRALQAALTQKSAQLEDVRGRIHLHRGTLSPLRSLPLEVMQHIFRLTLPATHNALLSPDEPPILLTRVCRAWREVALGTPELWASIHIVCTPFDSDMSERAREVVGLRLQAVETWLARSGTWPLDISIRAGKVVPRPVSLGRGPSYTSTVPSILRAILPHSRRWRDLAVVTRLNEAAELHLPLDVPQLRSFAFCEVGHSTTNDCRLPDFLSGAQGLQQVKLLYRRRDRLTALDRIPLRNIVSLHLRVVYASAALHSDLHKVLGECSHLQHLHLNAFRDGRRAFRRGSDEAPPYRGSHTVLPDLTTLDLSCCPAVAISLFDRVSAPSLQSLSLSIGGFVSRDASESRALSYFLIRSGAPVNKLRTTTAGAKLLGDCLPHVPDLNSLAIYQTRDLQWPHAVVLELLLQEGPDMPCPLLRSAEFDRCDVTVDWLLRFLRARASRLHNGHPVLRSVKARLSTPPSDNVDELVAPFRKRGVHVDVGWDERKQERDYRPMDGADWEMVVEEMDGHVEEYY